MKGNFHVGLLYVNQPNFNEIFNWAVEYTNYLSVKTPILNSTLRIYHSWQVVPESCALFIIAHDEYEEQISRLRPFTAINSDLLYGTAPKTKTLSISGASLGTTNQLKFRVIPLSDKNIILSVCLEEVYKVCYVNSRIPTVSTNDIEKFDKLITYSNSSDSALVAIWAKDRHYYISFCPWYTKGKKLIYDLEITDVVDFSDFIQYPDREDNDLEPVEVVK